jgi:VWFA-related protein
MMTLPARINLISPARRPSEAFMTVQRFVCTFMLLGTSGSLATLAQSFPASAPSSQSMQLDTVVDTKSGQPVTQLTQQNFTILDNKVPRPITSFRAATPADVPVSVIVIMDAVDMPYQMIAYAREGTERFLKSNEGQLADPTSISILTDQGIEIDRSFSTDGNALSDALAHHQIALREITRSSEWSGPDRLQICINALHQLVTFAASLPGRKVVLWISPGWPLVSGPNVDLDSKQERQIFNEVVNLSTQLRLTGLTLYNINPVGVQESLQRADFYQAFLKGISKPDQTQLGDLAIQVLASQSGGLAIESNSDVAGMIQRCLLDAKSWYEIGFDPLPADKPNEYHHIEVKVNQPGLVVRTRDGYYANPTPVSVK